MQSRYGRILFTVLTVFMTAFMVVYPKTVFEGAVLGLETWWTIVFPSLLPFFIISELLMALGIVHALGVLLEPVMRPVFRLPGAASFGLAVGYSSGYPIGSSIAARLRADGLCTRSEAEHLVSFTNNSSPLFILVALSVGMLHNPALGPFILLVHYMGNLIVGICFRYYAPEHRRRTAAQPHLWRRACHRFLEFGGKHPGQILGEAVRDAVGKLLVIGGFIILFAVIISLLRETGFLNVIISIIGAVTVPLGLSPALNEALASGLFEMTLGSRLVAESDAPLIQKLIAIQLILAWSGLSIQAQVSAFISTTDMRFLPYALSRIIHMLISVILTVILFPIFEKTLTVPASTFSNLVEPTWCGFLLMSLLLALVVPAALTSLGMLLFTSRRLFHRF